MSQLTSEGKMKPNATAISFLVLLRLKFDKTTENKSEKLICKNQAESKK